MPKVAIKSEKHQARSDSRVAVITLERTTCFGECPVYSVSIYKDGRVVYEGKEFVRIRGRQELKIPRAKVNQLLKEFEKCNFLAMDDEYPAIATDGPACITSLIINGTTKEVRHCYPSCTPNGLQELENKIDEIAGTDRYTNLEYPASGLRGH